MTFHTEKDYAPLVIDFVNDMGAVSFAEIYEHIESLDILNADDWQPTPSKVIRWKQIVRNLKCNGTVEADLISIDSGFCTKAYAEKYNLSLINDNVTLKEKYMFEDLKGEKNVRKVWFNKTFLPKLKGFDRNEVLADTKALTVAEFGKKYGLFEL